MRLSRPDPIQKDQTGIRRWDARRASAVFHFFFAHHPNRSAQLCGISAIITAAFLYFDTDDLCLAQYITILAGQGVVR
jgi:hypothetical protein